MSECRRKRKTTYVFFGNECGIKLQKAEHKKMLEHNISNLINLRSTNGMVLSQKCSLYNMANFGTSHMIKHKLYKEELIRCNNMDKVFSSTWIDSKQVVFGTKCNKLIVIDLTKKKMLQIPSLKSSAVGPPCDVPCGIHSIRINPSRTLLATGAENSNEIAIYKYPTFDPVCVGEKAHVDWIFDIAWLDDQFFVTGARDTTLALWRIEDKDCLVPTDDHFPNHNYMQPLMVKKCAKADKVRALVFNQKYQELVALSLNAHLHLWDAHTFKQKFSQELPFLSENVCLSMQEEKNLYAVGSKSHVSLIDACTLKPVCEIPSIPSGCSIRSTSFNDNLLTIGTGIGVLTFYDLRARKHMEQLVQSSVDASEYTLAKLVTSKGFVKQTSMFWDLYHSQREYHPAIYTHCYDETGTRLFVAGGPLPAFLEGCYVSLWQ